MFLLKFVVYFYVCSIYLATNTLGDVDNRRQLKPTVMVVVLVRNKAHSLPHFFGFLEQLDYPKDRLSFWIRSDHNEDNSTTMLRDWARGAENVYHSVNIRGDDSLSSYKGDSSPLVWSNERFTQVMKLKQKGLKAARKAWADYVWFLDADILLENPDTLSLLIAQDKTIVAPLLNITIPGSLYANFWGGMSSSGFYERVPDYSKIVNRHTQGCHAVPLVHRSVLIHLRDRMSHKLMFYPAPLGYSGPHDDIIQFALSASSKGVKMHILNTHFFGHMTTPLKHTDTLDDVREYFTHAVLGAIVNDSAVRTSHYIKQPPALSKDTLGFDEVYLINLERRPERRKRMLASLDILRVKVAIVDAVDGKQLNDTYLKDQGITMLPDYSDPYHGRPLTMGEIGCFMSHYIIWKDVLSKGYDRVIVLEDDLRFEVKFRQKLAEAISDADRLEPEWDLIYIGRKILQRAETFIGTKTNLVYPGYSYWTLAYALSKRGAQKLIDGDPLSKMVAVDEYLPIMFGQHDNAEWTKHFLKRDLVALSVNPLLITPTHYTGQTNYISDTEASIQINPDTMGPNYADPMKNQRKNTQDISPMSDSEAYKIHREDLYPDNRQGILPIGPEKVVGKFPQGPERTQSYQIRKDAEILGSVEKVKREDL